jgi:hypothetical protein
MLDKCWINWDKTPVLIAQNEPQKLITLPATILSVIKFDTVFALLCFQLIQSTQTEVVYQILIRP